MLQLVISGLAMGSIYALVALGFLLIYVAVGAINFAQGDMVMLGAFFGVTFATMLGWPLWLAYLLSMLLMLVFGYVFERIAYYPLRDKPFLTVIISTIAVGIILRNLAIQDWAWGPEEFFFGTLVSDVPIELGDAVILPQHLFIIGLTVALLVAQYLFFEKTFLGRKLQATAQDQEAARLMGIKVERMMVITFIMSSFLAAIAGLILAPVLFVSTNMGFHVGVKAFVASIVGGFGSMAGAISGGLFLGLLEVFGAAYISSAYKDAFAVLIMLVVLFVRPQGFFGEKIQEKV